MIEKVHIHTLWINYDPLRVHHQQLYHREHKWTSPLDGSFSDSEVLLRPALFQNS